MQKAFLIVFFSLWSLAASALPNGIAESNFDLKEANKQFDLINIKLSTQNLNRDDLDGAVDMLESLDAQATSCTNDAQKKLNELSIFSAQDVNATASEKQNVDLVFLDKQKKQLINQRAQCRLFSIRAKEAIFAYKTTIARLVKEEAFTRELTLVEAGQQAYSAYSPEWFSTLEKSLPTFPIPTAFNIAFLLLSVGIAVLLLFRLKQSQTLRSLSRKKAIRLYHVLLLTVTFYVSCITFYQFTLTTATATNSPAFAFLALLLCYLLLLNAISFFFKTKTIRNYCLWYSLDSGFFQNLACASLTLAALGIFGNQLAKTLSLSSVFIQLGQSTFLFLTLMSTYFFIYYFCRAHKHFRFIQVYQRKIRFTALFWLVSCIILDIQGYHYLAMHVAFAGLISLAIATVTAFISLEINKVYSSLYKKPATLEWISRYIGYQQDQVFTELLMIKVIAQCLIIAIGIYYIGESLDFATYYVESIYTQLIDGAHLGSVTIYPLRILLGVLTFSILLLLSRCLATRIIRHHQFDNEEETQVALASILTYIGFAFALLSGLIIAGFNFTGLAIVAGALSVGIGLGLQSIVNNFVSGLILLIEKPIQPGDRINVDGAEGFVKKIRIRSTHIVSPNREDIIIPNSELITRKVTNYMFSDKNCRISCEVGVAYNSDTRHVTEILMEIANQHDDVIKTGRSKPFVLFSAFSESNLTFQLWCVIKDVNRKYFVQSDLNHAINDNFRKHNIYMDYPKRDVHITEVTAESSETK